MRRSFQHLGNFRVGLMPVIAIAATMFTSGKPGEVPSGNRSVVIRMTDDMKFIPEHPTIAVGDTVVWINEGGLPHTATDVPGTAAIDEHNVLPDGAEPWDSGLLNAGQRYSMVFAVTGDYTYLCVFHEAAGMVGRLTVEPATGTRR